MNEYGGARTTPNDGDDGSVYSSSYTACGRVVCGEIKEPCHRVIAARRGDEMVTHAPGPTSSDMPYLWYLAHFEGLSFGG